MNPIVPTNRIILSSAFSNRMLIGEALVVKKDLSIEEAKEIVTQAESDSAVTFLNAINPRHKSTCALAKGLTHTECTGEMVTLEDGDVVVIMQPSAASRNDTEFNLAHFEECIFQLIQQIPLSMLQK